MCVAFAILPGHPIGTDCLVPADSAVSLARSFNSYPRILRCVHCLAADHLSHWQPLGRRKPLFCEQARRRDTSRHRQWYCRIGATREPRHLGPRSAVVMLFSSLNILGTPRFLLTSLVLSYSHVYAFLGFFFQLTWHRGCARRMSYIQKLLHLLLLRPLRSSFFFLPLL